MISSQDSIGQIAVRIERAYGRRYSRWKPDGLTDCVWMSAASRLMEAADLVEGAPVDPELFVAVQPRSRLMPNPWAELTQECSREVYLKAIRRIVLQLRKELRSEVRRAERRLDLGESLDQVLAADATGLTPLSRYILAHRAGRIDLAARHRAAAESQHHSCPLYRVASRSFLPGHVYPFPELTSAAVGRAGELIAFSLN